MTSWVAIPATLVLLPAPENTMRDCYFLMRGN